MSNSAADKVRAKTKAKQKVFMALTPLIESLNKKKKIAKLPEYKRILRMINSAGQNKLWHFKQLLESLRDRVLN
jgi:hypothetical protein